MTGHLLTHIEYQYKMVGWGPKTKPPTEMATEKSSCGQLSLSIVLMTFWKSWQSWNCQKTTFKISGDARNIFSFLLIPFSYFDDIREKLLVKFHCTILEGQGFSEVWWASLQHNWRDVEEHQAAQGVKEFKQALNSLKRVMNCA